MRSPGVFSKTLREGKNPSRENPPHVNCVPAVYLIRVQYTNRVPYVLSKYFGNPRKRRQATDGITLCKKKKKSKHEPCGSRLKYSLDAMVRVKNGFSRDAIRAQAEKRPQSARTTVAQTSSATGEREFTSLDIGHRGCRRVGV